MARPSKWPLALDAGLVQLLQGPDFHGEIGAYLLRERCQTVGAFCCWVDEAREWTTLLQGELFPTVKRRHIAHIKDCWQRLREVRDLGLEAEAGDAALAWGTPSQEPPRSGRQPLFRSSVEQRMLEVQAKAEQTDPAFWKSFVERHCRRGRSRRPRVLLGEDLLEVTPGQLDEIFAADGEGPEGGSTMPVSKLCSVLVWLGLPVTEEAAGEIAAHLLEKQGNPQSGIITRSSFERLVKELQLAGLYTPGLARVDQCQLLCCDYHSDGCTEVDAKGEDDGFEFFFGARRPYVQAAGTRLHPPDEGGPAGRGVMWLHLDATEGLDRPTLLRLAVKYNLHSLAIDAVLDKKRQTKVEQYGDHYVVSVEIVSLAKSSESPLVFDNEIEDLEPPRVRINRSQATMFMPKHLPGDMVLTIHQDVDDSSSWLAMWREEFDIGEEEEEEKRVTLWEELVSDVVKRSSTGGIFKSTSSARSTASAEESHSGRKRVREEGADFLMYEILHRVIVLLRPVAYAYAKRLGWMYRQPPQSFTQTWVKEISEIKLEVHDLLRFMRPSRQMVKFFLEDPHISAVTRMYLEDMALEIDAIAEDVAQLTRTTEILEQALQQFRDKRINDTLFALSLVTAIFLPLQFISQWYGMNFQTMPEYYWATGYDYLCIVMLCAFGATFFVVVLLTGRMKLFRTLFHNFAKGQQVRFHSTWA